MTSIVGVYCNDGIVVGTDSSTTSAAGDAGNPIRTIEQRAQKLFIIHKEAILAGTGSVGLNQRFRHEVEQTWKEKECTGAKTPIEKVCVLGNKGVNNFAHTGVRQDLRNMSYGALLAGSCNGHAFLCEYEQGSLQPELKSPDMWHVSMGSGQLITDTFLGFLRRVVWKEKQPTLEEGILCAVWTLLLAIELNPGGINSPIQMGVIRKTKTGPWEAVQLDESDIEMHASFIGNAEKALSDAVRELLVSRNGLSIPVPTPQ